MNMDDLTRGEWHRRYMASLDDAGIGSKSGRKEWQEANHFPASTKDWQIETYHDAVARILEPFVADFERLCGERDIDPQEFARLVWPEGTWLRVRDYIAAIEFLKVLPDARDRIMLGAQRSGLTASLHGSKGEMGSDIEGAL